MIIASEKCNPKKEMDRSRKFRKNTLPDERNKFTTKRKNDQMKVCPTGSGYNQIAGVVSGILKKKTSLRSTLDTNLINKIERDKEFRIFSAKATCASLKNLSVSCRGKNE